jgi:hypothetical protein
MGTLKEFRDAIGYPQEDNNVAERFALQGGLSIEEVAALGDPGKLLACKNYEPNYSGGYRSKGGCEPVDGHRQPSAFVYQLIPVTITNGANVPTVVGQQINQRYAGISEIGPFFLGWETINGQRYLVLTNVLKTLITSSYDAKSNSNAGDENYVDVVTNYDTGSVFYTGTAGSPLNFATATGKPTFLSDNGKATAYISSARKVARSLIQPVGGAAGFGPALGVFDVAGHLFAIRNLAPGSGGVGTTQAGLWTARGPGNPGALSSVPGWKQCTLGSIVYFQNNNDASLVEGITVNTVSGASASVDRLVIMFGTVGGGDACGYFSTRTITGDPTFGGNGAAIRIGTTTVATTPASGTVVRANSLPKDGKYRFRRWNFTGVAKNTRIYGVNGVGTAFEIYAPEGSVAPPIYFTPIITGQGLTVATFNGTPTADTPTKISAAHDQLFLCYPGGNMQHSGYQTPTNWTAVQGADQRELGEDVTNIVENINNTVLITTRNRMRMLYGDVNENFQLRDLNTEAGALDDTAQPIGGVCLLTDEGVNFYDQAAQFGNFNGTSLSQAINSLLKSYMATGNGALEATIQRDHSLYRLYFDAGICFSFCIVGSELRGIGRCDYSLGSTITTMLGSTPAFSVGDTIYNQDNTVSCVVRGIYQTGIFTGYPNTTILTDTVLNLDDWPAGTDIHGLGVAAQVDTVKINSVRRLWSCASTITNGNYATPTSEKIYFACEDGFLYEDDVGGSFGVQGAAIDASFQTQFYYGSEAIDNLKKYRRVRLDIIGATVFSNISISAEYDDGYGYRAPEKPEIITQFLAPSSLDEMSSYGIGFYGPAGKNIIRKELHGTGVAISLLATANSDIAFPHTIQASGLVSARRARRGWR